MDEYKKENAKFKEASFQGKKEFYSNLDMEYITDAYQKHTKRYGKTFK